jgi:hypothetical protein
MASTGRAAPPCWPAKRRERAALGTAKEVSELSERFNSHANYPMLAQATTHDNYTRGVRSRAATGSNPQASFALAHVPTRP